MFRKSDEVVWIILIFYSAAVFIFCVAFAALLACYSVYLGLHETNKGYDIVRIEFDKLVTNDVFEITVESRRLFIFKTRKKIVLKRDKVKIFYINGENERLVFKKNGKSSLYISKKNKKIFKFSNI